MCWWERKVALLLSAVGTEISAIEENREVLSWKLRLAVLIFLIVKQLVSYRHVWLSVELQTMQTCGCEVQAGLVQWHV